MQATLAHFVRSSKRIGHAAFDGKVLEKGQQLQTLMLITQRLSPAP